MHWHLHQLWKVRKYVKKNDQRRRNPQRKLRMLLVDDVPIEADSVRDAMAQLDASESLAASRLAFAPLDEPAGTIEPNGLAFALLTCVGPCIRLLR